MNLYEVLGVDVRSTLTTIKKAYREKAKGAHPDRGGDAEAFHRLTLAYNVLSDPKRRKLYDETGEYQPVLPDNSHVRLVNNLTALFVTLMTEIVQKNANPTSFDFVEALRKTADNRIKTLNQALENQQNNLGKLQRLKGRFKSKNNLLEGIRDAQEELLLRSLNNVQAQLDGINEARSYLDTADFDWDQMVAWTMNSSTTTNAFL